MILGCTNPAAINYNPASDQDDGSCIYLHKVADTCYAFKDFDHNSLGDQSFTVSYSIEDTAWVFYHDYIPDFYFSTRQQLYSLKNTFIWEHNMGPRGKFYKLTKSSFFIDVVFTFPNEVLLNSVQWLTQVIDVMGKTHSNSTFTHITIWNDSQCTGRIPITEYAPLNPEGITKNLSQFSFNDFRDIVKSNTEFFMKSVFEDIRPEDALLDPNMPWYEKGYMQNRFFVIRLEFDNQQDKEVSLHEVDVIVDPTYK